LLLDLSQKQTFNVLLFIKIIFFLNRSWKN